MGALTSTIGPQTFSAPSSHPACAGFALLLDVVLGISICLPFH